MTEHTPTTDEVRESFVDGAAGEFIEEDFDRWLAEVRREAEARGHEAGYRRGYRDRRLEKSFNPHREETA